MAHTLPANTASSSSALVGYWYSADGQGFIDMTGATAAEAVAELLGQCGTGEERAVILAGRFVLADEA